MDSAGDSGSAALRIAVADDADIVIATKRVRELAAEQGLSEAAAARLATAVAEIACNMIVHAVGGELAVAAATDRTRRGVVVVALDRGPGIADIDQAMRDGFSTSASLGFGLPGARRLVDEFEIESCVGAGTRVTLRKWAG